MSGRAMLAALNGQYFVRHAILTVGGTWSLPGTQYPSFIVAGASDWCYEVPVPYPASFGPIGGAITSESYQQSCTDAETWIVNWLNAYGLAQTWGIWGYSQGAEAVARIVMRVLIGDLQQFLPTFIGGGTLGNPSRMEGAHAPTMADPGGHGISTDLMTELPNLDGRPVWADYCHSTANGDAANDMYTIVPDGQVGQDMTDIYSMATNLQVTNMGALAQTLMHTLVAAVSDLGLTSGVKGGVAGLLLLPVEALIGLLTDLIAGPQINAKPGASAAVQAAVEAIKFLAAPGGPTAPHISYAGEIPGYSNVIPDAAAFLTEIAQLTPATQAA